MGLQEKSRRFKTLVECVVCTNPLKATNFQFNPVPFFLKELCTWGISGNF
jgi:hypothetical protein